MPGPNPGGPGTHTGREIMAAGDAKTEAQRRARVVKGWAFKDLTDEQQKAIRAYLAGGPVPPGYEELDRVVR